MAYPYHLYTKTNPVSLYKLSDGRFQMTTQGNLSEIITGVQYILIENSLANFLKKLKIEAIQYKDAIIYNRKFETEYNNYTQITLETNFLANEIDNLDLSGIKMYLMNSQYLFISPKLKEILSKSEFTYLQFSEGLSLFA